MDQLTEQLLNANQEQDPNAGKIPVNLGNGQILYYDNAEQLSTNLQVALGQVNQEYTSLQNKYKELENQYQQVRQTTGQYVKDDGDVQRFDTNTFIQKMQANPVEAFDYIDQFRNNPYKEKLNELEELRQENEVNKFIQAHPEFPGGQWANVLNATREQLKQPMTKIGLEVALNHAIQTNRMPDFKTGYLLENQKNQMLNYLQQQGIDTQQLFPNMRPPVQNNVVPQQPLIQQNNQQQFQQQYQNLQRPGIPTVPRPNATPTSLDSALQNAESMDLSSLEKILKQNGLLG